MIPEHLLAHFDRISDTPEAIPRLRRFILDLAVRGKLVEQDPRDEPASELLKRIQAENRQVKNIIDPLVENEQPFKIPHSWAWIQIGNAAHVEMGQSPPSENYNKSGNGIPFYQGKTDFGIRNPTPRYWCNLPSKLAQKNDILISVRAPVGPTNFASEECCIGRGLAALRPRHGVYLEFLLYSLKGFEAAIAAIGYGTTFVAITKSQLVSFAIPLPPLAEQHRIVAKVDELMALCDRLETAQTERESRRDSLVASSLHRLNNGADPDAFREHARFYFNHLPRLTTRPDHIKQLRQTILNLAVRGKLVPQDPTDEMEIELLNHSTEMQATRIDSLTIPDSWKFAYLKQVAIEIVDCPHSTPKWTGHGKICVRTSQFRPGFLDLKTSRFVSQATFTERIQRLRPQKDDILYSREGGILGVACRVPPNVDLCLGQRMMLIRPHEKVVPPYLELVLNSPLITEIARAETTGGAAPRVNVSIVKEYPIPLPPFAEQHRIVAKVDELMALCDQLETQLTTNQSESQKLMEAIVRDLLVA